MPRREGGGSPESSSPFGPLRTGRSLALLRRRRRGIDHRHERIAGLVAKADGVIIADSAIGRLADDDAFHLAELAVKELLPFHIIYIARRQWREMPDSRAPKALNAPTTPSPAIDD